MKLSTLKGLWLYITLRKPRCNKPRKGMTCGLPLWHRGRHRYKETKK